MRESVVRRLGSGALAEIREDRWRPGTFELVVDGTPQSHVDLDDPTDLSFEYVRRMGHVIDRIGQPGQPITAVHLGAGALTLGLPAAAAIGALGTAAVVYGLSWRSGVDSYRLILVGIGATAALTGVTSYLIARAQFTEASTAAQWLVGSLSGVSWASVWPVLVAVAVLTPIALTQSSTLSVSLLGDDVSTGLGVAVQRHRLVIVACAVLLTAAAVSAAGPIEFVAFVSPQIVRRLAGTARPPLLASAVVGALVVVGADTLSRTVLPGEVPVGIVTAVIGAPYLIWLLTRRKDREMLT